LRPEQNLSRAQIAQDLWPDDPESAGLSWIRDSLYNLRKVAGIDAALHVTPDSIRWTPPASYYLDVAVHKHALAQCQQAMRESRAPEVKQWVQDVAATMQGELLPDLEGQWIDELRESMRVDSIRTLEEVGAFLWQRDELAAALQITTKLIAIDPLREASYRLRMEILSAAREYSALEDTYLQLSKRLRAELEAEPSETTERFYQQSMSAHTLAIAPRTPASADSQMPHQPIGRQTEWQRLYNLWEDVKGTGSRCVLISGEAGIGKTFLADRFVQHLQESGVFVLRTRSYADDELGAFAPIYDWMKDQRLQTAIERLPVKMQQEIARFHPQLMKRNSALSFPEPAIHPYHRRLLFDSIQAVLDELDAMIVLYFDDIHWLDRETIAWLKHVLRHGGHSRPLLILGTVRTEDLMRSGEFRDWMESLTQSDLLTRITLRRLSRRETMELIDTAGDIPFSADAKLTLFQLTEGNPLCIVEYLRTDLVKREHQSSVPEKIRALALERVRVLSTQTQDLVWFAAIVGREFDHTLLELGLNQGEYNILDALEDACRVELFLPISETTYRFSHGLVQEAIYESLLPAKRQSLHRRCAAAFKQRHQEDLGRAAAM
ncbi:MAG: AAA family ATPase, partial [Anaerolineae bacterium]|nr:AAA family ATPase [Anaerolineae bacterium]